MSSSSAAPPGPEGRARQALRKVFGFQAFRTALQESATMAVVRGERGARPSGGRPVAEPQGKVAGQGSVRYLPSLAWVFVRTWLQQTRCGERSAGGAGSSTTGDCQLVVVRWG